MRKYPSTNMGRAQIGAKPIHCPGTLAGSAGVIPIGDHNPTRRTPWISYLLIAGCTTVFFWQIGLGEQGFRTAVQLWGLKPAQLFGHTLPFPDLPPAWMTLLTSQFLHGGWLHLIMNMLFLFVFANNVEDSMTRPRFLLFYLTCGVLAAGTHAALDPTSAVPMVGASGAISGVLGAYLLLYPRSRILVLVPLIVVWPLLRLPAGLLLGGWFVLQLVQSTTPAEGGGVAFAAHAGGFVAGVLLLPAFKRRDVRLFSQWNQ